MPASLVWFWVAIIGCSQVSDEETLIQLDI